LSKAGCDVNQAMSDGATPAYIAAYNGHTAALELLVKAGCDVNRAIEEERTPAFAAAQGGHTVVLEILVKVPGCDVNQATKAGRL
jgi:ankyrin repeat protein